MKKEKISLINIKGGAAVELFDGAMQRVYENINDINTTLKPREVNLKVVFIPSADRTIAVISMECTAKLAYHEAEKTTADLRLDERGRAIAYERANKQIEIFPANVTAIKGE